MLPKERPLEATVRRRGEAVIIDLHGEINALSNEVLSQAYAEADTANPSAILLNFGDVEYINSTGIALIVGLLAEARRAQRRILTYGLNDHYTDIFKITRLADFMGIYPDEDAALQDL